MVFLVCGGVVQAEERPELLQPFLRGVASHFLRFVQDNDGMVRRDDVNRPPGAEGVQFRADAAGVLAAGVERLDIDDHYLNVRALAEMIDLRQVFGIVHEEPRFPAVILHEVVFHGLKAPAHAFTDGNVRHDDNELAPPVLLVQLKQRLDVHIGLAGACFHFDIDRAVPQPAGQFVRRLDVVSCLNPVDIFKNLLRIQQHLCVCKARIKLVVGKVPVGYIPLNPSIPAVGEAVIVGLPGKHVDHTLHSLRLVGLDCIFKFHITHRRHLCHLPAHSSKNSRCLS